MVFLENAEKLFEGRKKMIDVFKKIVFSYPGNHQDSEGNFYDLADLENLPELRALESEESAARRNNQSGQGLKILTSNQILSSLLIL